MKCAAFWNHTNIRQNKKIYPCCRFKRPIADFDGNIDKILYSNEYNTLRDMSINNKKIPECSKCYYEESLGKKSLRQKFNEEYNTNEIKLKFLEIGFDNICNLTCDACGPEFSHSWAKKLGIDNIIDTSKLEIIPSKDLEKIVFLGGEPLMTNRHYTFLSKIKDPSAVSVTYVTNGTFLLNEKILEILHKFKNVNFIVSIDGYGELNNKVRSGSDWNNILKFLSQLEKNKFSLTINTTIHKNNWFGLKELSEFVKDRSYDWDVHVVTYPKNFDIAHCQNKDKIKNYLQSIDFPNKEYIIEHLG